MRELTKERRSEIRELLVANEWKCNAAGRQFIFENIGALEPNTFKTRDWIEVLQYAERIGGCKPRETYEYPNAQGGMSTARVFDLYDIPDGLVNPYLVCFSGFMTAHLYAMEAIRFYAKNTGKLLPKVCTGKEGNKGLFREVFERSNGAVIGTEADIYNYGFSLLAPKAYAEQNTRICADVDTHGNFDEMYNFAKEQGLTEVTFILCSGNFSYDKRLLAEGMLQLKDEKYADVVINLTLVHCPMNLTGKVPEAHVSEIFLGYVAASLGPLMKDTITFDGQTSSAKPERYLMPGVAEAEWDEFKDLICGYSNMGWPNYQVLLYGISHEEAVMNIILSDLRARGSFTPREYDLAFFADIEEYVEEVGEYAEGDDFLCYLRESRSYGFFR